uniref:Integrin alpha-PS1 n=1 Tax=Hemiscolopendra marginata TaxID=943146 RepID=A0A646QFY9_9MYRI
MKFEDLTVIFINLLILIYVVNSFNLDPRIPVIKTGDPNTYFGFSVAEHIVLGGRYSRSPLDESRLLVGAPRAKSGQPGTNHTGAIFQCPLTGSHSDCRKLDIDDSGFVDDEELKDDQWLGVTVRSQGPGGYVMACAHRYVKKGVNYRWGNGICYSLSQDLDFQNPFDPCYNRPVEKAHEQYGYCQAGTSGVITEDNNIVIGTPGPYTWRGTVFINSVAQGLNDDISWYMGPVLDQVSPVEKYSYLGMSVTSGKFFKNKMSFVTGAPRANNVGQVIFYTKEKGATLAVQLILSGELFASSYGYEIATADLNNDRLPDLIVGAPFYYGKDIGGAIYVYINSERGINTKTVPVKITGKADSRFGFAIANCSDLNKDNYEDIAVGAPYEGNGVVYIYLGSKTGINTVPSQIIKAEDIHGKIISSFGHSLSGGMDLDNNGYPDLLVGAYESDTVILLRARPIIQITTTILTGDLVISPNTPGCERDPFTLHSCFSFRTCFVINSQEAIVTSSVNVSYSIEAETFRGRKRSRVYFKGKGDTEEHKIQRHFSLPIKRTFRGLAKASSDEKCDEELVYLRNNTRDILNPVFFRLTYSLVQDAPPSRYLPSLPNINDYPILNQQEASKIFQVPFEKDCGDDDICESDLQVKAVTYPKETLVLGEVENVTLEITVFNKKESAYEAAVYILHSESLGYVKGDTTIDNVQYHCKPHDNKVVVVCSLSNPFKKLPEPTVITIYFNPSKVKTLESQLYLTVITNSTSKEVTPKPPIHIPLNVVRRAKLSYIGKVIPEQVKYSGEIRGASAMTFEEDIGSEVIHRHMLKNEGPSDISSLTLTIHWPYEIENSRDRGKYLLYLVEPPTFYHSYGSCNIDKRYINELNLRKKSEPKRASGPAIDDKEFTETVDSLTTDSDKSATSERKESSEYNRTVTRTETRTETRSETKRTSKTTRTSEESESTRKKREASSAQTSSQSSQKKTIVFECNTTAKCLKFQCSIYNLWKNSLAELRFKSRLWNSTLVMDYPDVHAVQIITTVDIEVDPVSKVELVDPVPPSRQQVITTAYPEISIHTPQEIPFWIYILAACIGILLLVLLILCLWKIGFFKRKKPDEMMKGNLEKRNEMNSHDY